MKTPVIRYRSTLKLSFWMLVSGVCVYLRNSISFKTCQKFSNSVCDLLIVSLQTPSLIIILVYRPPSGPAKDFKEISYKIHTCVMSLLPPPLLPNIILFGDFNLHEINWSSLNPSCPTAGSLLKLTNLTFLNQHVSEPIRNCNIIDLVFCPDNTIKYITVSDSFFSEHRVIYAETFTPVHDPSTVQIDQNLNHSPPHQPVMRFWTLISQIGQISRSLLILLIGPLHFCSTKKTAKK